MLQVTFDVDQSQPRDEVWRYEWHRRICRSMVCQFPFFLSLVELFFLLNSTDELQKSAAYMTETYYLSPSKQTRAGTDPVRAPFCFAFDTVKNKTGFFGWLEGEIHAGVGNDGPDDR
jgi:hypothetical protein